MKPRYRYNNATGEWEESSLSYRFDMRPREFVCFDPSGAPRYAPSIINNVEYRLAQRKLNEDISSLGESMAVNAKRIWPIER